MISRIAYKYIVVCLSVFLGGCDPLVEYKFIIHNKSDDNVYVKYSDRGNDTIITIFSGSEREVYTKSTVNKTAEDYVTDSVYYFGNIQIITEDSMVLDKDFKTREAWEFYQQSEKEGIYKLTIENKDLD